jgi:hypothetical protein
VIFSIVQRMVCIGVTPAQDYGTDHQNQCD